MRSPVLRYVVSSAFLGGAVGIAHGSVRGAIELYRDTGSVRPLTQYHALEYIGRGAANDGLQGALLGPWAPVLVPLWFTAWRSQMKCPHFIRQLK